MNHPNFLRGACVRIFLVILMAAGLSFLPAHPVQAIPCSTSVVVTSPADSGAGSLREAVAGVCPGGTVTFAPALSGQTITLTTGEITLDQDMTIDGSSLSSQVTISGNHASRIFYVNDVSVSFESLTLVDGQADNGAGIDASSGGSVHVDRCTFKDNTAPSPSAYLKENFDGVTAPALPAGWATSHTDAESDWTTTSVSYSTPNSAFAPDPAGIGLAELDSPSFVLEKDVPLTFELRYNLENGYDGGVLEISIDGGAFQDILIAGGTFNWGGYSLMIPYGFGNPLSGRMVWTGTQSFFSSVSVNLPASAVGHTIQLRWLVGSDASVGKVGMWIDDVSVSEPPSEGGAIRAADLFIANSTFIGNGADQGGAVYNEGLGTYIGNSTFSGNTANNLGGAIYNRNYYDASVEIAYSTFVGNTAPTGSGGIDGDNGGNGIDFTDTVLSANTPNNCGSGSNYASYDYNLSSDGTCNLTASNDKTSTDPKLGSLANNGGPTLTFALLAGSPAIDPGVNADPDALPCPETDQRGITRPVGTSCDAGAYEYDATPTVSSGNPADGSLITTGISSLQVNFNKPVLSDGSAGAANNVTNYLLVEAGANGAFDTLSCVGGQQPDDTRVTVNSAVYNTSTHTATLTVNSGTALPNGSYRLFVCGTTSIYDLYGTKLNNGLADSTLSFRVNLSSPASSPSQVPSTGFAPGRVSVLPAQTVSYSDLGDLWLEIPKLGVQMPIVGVPLSADGTWDVSWLGKDAGWLNGSAYPASAGNSVLTGHVYDAYGQPGPFRYLNTLWWGDRVIVHSGTTQYVYEVRSVTQVSPGNTAAMLKHESLPWLTLVTCRGYDQASNSYQYRILVRAVLVSVK